MTLPDSAKVIEGTQLVLADSTYVGSTLGTPARTAQLDLDGLGNGSYRQSAQLDFGLNRDLLYDIAMAWEVASAPSPGVTVDLYAAWSSSSGSSDNPGGTSGTDSAYVGWGTVAADATEAVLQLDFLGSLILTADNEVQYGHVGVIQPPKRYGNIVVFNDSGVAHIADAVEACIVFTPITHQVQEN